MREFLWGLAGVVTGGSLVGCLALSWSTFNPSNEQRPLKEALIKLEAASSQGVTVMTFGDLVLEARTKLELARSHLKKTSLDPSEKAVADFEATKQIWQATIEEGAQYCPSACRSALEQPLTTLGILSEKTTWESYAQDPTNRWTELRRKQTISEALTISALQAKQATGQL